MPVFTCSRFYLINPESELFFNIAAVSGGVVSRPPSWVFFGILHPAVSSVVTWPHLAQWSSRSIIQPWKPNNMWTTWRATRGSHVTSIACCKKPSPPPGPTNLTSHVEVRRVRPHTPYGLLWKGQHLDRGGLSRVRPVVPNGDSEEDGWARLLKCQAKKLVECRKEKEWGGEVGEAHSWSYWLKQWAESLA